MLMQVLNTARWNLRQLRVQYDFASDEFKKKANTFFWWAAPAAVVISAFLGYAAGGCHFH